MAHALGNQRWTTFLPKTYEWIGSVAVACEAAPTDTCHVAMGQVDEENGKKTLTVLGSGMTPELRGELAAALSKLGWRGDSPLILTTPKAGVSIVVPAIRIKTSAAQVGRQVGLDAAKALRSISPRSISLYGDEGADALAILEGITEGFCSTNLFKDVATAQPPGFPERISLVGSKASKEAIDNVRHICRASALTRLLQDAPANWASPETLAEVARQMASDLGLTCRTLGRLEMQELGFGALLSVGKGSDSEPQLIVLEAKGRDSKRTLSLVGKGVTFDAGGINIKGSAGLHEMKFDMSGGAAVLGTMHYLAQVKPAMNVVGIVGAVENLLGGSATKPGDVIRAHNGKTVEVINTDAEGRLVLADAMHYAIKTYQPNAIIDIATLTGAVIVALGHAGAGICSNNDGLAAQAESVAKTSGEPVWRLPLWPELLEEVKGTAGDFANVPKESVKAGTIMGGHFLAQFVGDTPWLHIDIAGTAWGCSATGYPKTGGSGYGLRLLAGLCLGLEKLDK